MNSENPEDKINSEEQISINDPVKTYLSEIRKQPLLTPNEEEELFNKILTGSEEEAKRAKEKIITSNLRLVVSIARNYVGRGLLFLDLIQEGNLGLMKAVERFDISKGYKFSTYATYWIEQVIGRSIANKGKAIRLPVKVCEAINKYKKEKQRIANDLQREPTVEDMLEHTEYSKKEIIELEKLILQNPVSLNTKINDKKKNEDGDTELLDFVPDTSHNLEDEFDASYVKDITKKLLSKLNQRQRKIIELRYGLGGMEPQSLEQIGNMMGVTRERIRQIEAAGLRKIQFITDNGTKDAIRSTLELDDENKAAKRTFYENFYGYTKEELDEVVSNLPQKAKHVIELYYGNGLDKPSTIISSNSKYAKQKNKSEVYKLVVASIRKKLAENHELKSIENEPQEDEEPTESILQEIETGHITLNSSQTSVSSNIPVKTIYDYFSFYRREEIDTMLQKLTPEEMELVTLKYGEDLNNPRESRLSEEQSEKYLTVLIQRMRYLLYTARNPVKQELVPITVKTIKKEKTIYDYFSFYRREEIDAEIALLHDIEKKELTKDPRTGEFYNIIAKIRKRLNNNTLEKRKPPQSSSPTRRTIYEILFEYPQEEIDAEIAKLSEEYQEIIKDKSEKRPQKFYDIMNALRSRLASSKGKERRTIYEILKDYSKEEIDAEIAKLSEENQEIIKDKSEKRPQKFYNIMNALRSRLARPKGKERKTIYEILKDYSKEEIDAEIAKLSKENQEIIKDKSEKRPQKFYNIMNALRSRLASSKGEVSRNTTPSSEKKLSGSSRGQSEINKTAVTSVEQTELPATEAVPQEEIQKYLKESQAPVVLNPSTMSNEDSINILKVLKSVPMELIGQKLDSPTEFLILSYYFGHINNEYCINEDEIVEKLKYFGIDKETVRKVKIKGLKILADLVANTITNSYEEIVSTSSKKRVLIEQTPKKEETNNQ